MNHRAYQSPTDITLLQTFNASAFAQTAGCGYLHPGDIPHRLFNGNKLFDPAEVLTIWEDEAGVAAWVLTGPRHRGFDAQVRPDLRDDHGFEREVLEYAETQTLMLMQRHGVDGEHLIIDAFRCDTTRVELLAELGWARADEPPWVVNQAPLVDLPAPLLPEGYRIRATKHRLTSATHTGCPQTKMLPPAK